MKSHTDLMIENARHERDKRSQEHWENTRNILIAGLFVLFAWLLWSGEVHAQPHGGPSGGGSPYVPSNVNITGGTITGTSITVLDNVFTLQNATDPTKQFKFSLTSLSTATTRTWIVPDASDTFVGIAATQTLTNKTLTTPVISGGTIDNTVIGGTTPAAATVTTLTANNTVSLSPANASVTVSPTGTGTVTINPATAGTINNMSVGQTTAAAGSFTTLSASSTVSGTGFSNYLASPPAIGSTAPAAVSATVFHLPQGANGVIDMVTGGSSDMFLYNRGTGNLNFGTNNSTQWSINNAGHLLTGVDNGRDLGGTSNRVRTGYFGTSVLLTSSGKLDTIADGKLNIDGTATTTAIAGTITVSAIASSGAAQTGYLCYNTSGGVVTYDSGATCLVSREEYKDNYGAIHGALDIVRRLKPFWGAYKEGTPMSDRHVQPFLGARATAHVDTRLVSFDKESMPLGVRYENMSALLIAAMQEQQVQINSLRAEIAELKRRGNLRPNVLTR